LRWKKDGVGASSDPARAALGDVVTRLSLNWRSINGPNQLTLLLAGERFVDGKLHRDQPTNMEGAAA
jgi:hypothetical protein